MQAFPQIKVVNHPLAEHKLAYIRNKNTLCEQFRRLVYELSLILFFEATKDLTCKTIDVETPLEMCKAKTLVETPTLIPILRAGLGMVDAFLALIPTAKIGHIGMMRNSETHLPESYYFNIPENSYKSPTFVCDPMLATGGTVVKAIDELKQRKFTNISLVTILAAPEGVEQMQKHHPDVTIYTASLERQLNEKSYILPGLGDAGDRLYGTQ